MGIKKILFGIVVLATVDYLLPDVQTGAQIAIAPAIIAAIVGAVGSMAAAEKAKQGALAQSSGAAAAGGGAGGGGIDMSPEGVPTSAELEQSPSKHQQAVESKNINPDQPIIQPGQLQNPQAWTMLEKGSVHNPGNITDSAEPYMPPADEGFGNVPPPKEGGGFFKDMSTADKLSMAASLGSLLRGPGAPPPPSVSGGGRGIEMTPVFLNSIYGRRG